MTYSDSNESGDEIDVKSDNSHLLGIIFCLIGAWLTSLILASNRYLKGIETYTIMFLHGLVGLIIGVIYAIAEGLYIGNVFIIF